MLCQREDDAERSQLAGEDRVVTLADLFIRTKEKTLVPLSPNPVQVMYLDLLAPGWREAPPSLEGLREYILKARQFGFSTLIGALFFCDTINNPNTTTVVVAHDKETTEKLFRMVQIFYDRLPPHKQPRTKYASKREFYWPDLNSSYYVGTAGSKEFGRSQTINNLHCSEAAFYPDAETLMTGLLNAVPKKGNVFIESTANGVGDWYHREYLESRSGRNGYDGQFFPWFQHDEYRLDPKLAPPPDSEDRQVEDQLRELYGLDEDQLAWRRAKMREPGMRKKFTQEYPANEREAFVASGTPYFDAKRLVEMEAGLAKSVAVSIPDRFPRLQKALKAGDLEVFVPPQPGRQYVVSADTAEGVDQHGNHDFDSADVLDCETWDQVGHLHGKWDTHEYGLMLAELGFWYNTALLGIERNNHGHAVINAALHSGKYPEMTPGVWRGLYFHEEYDETKKMSQRKPGWPTTIKTKFFALDGLATSVESADLKVRSRKTLGEMAVFQKQPRGKAGAPPGAHDDQVMSLAIGDALLKLRPRPASAPSIPPALRIQSLSALRK